MVGQRHLECGIDIILDGRAETAMAGIAERLAVTIGSTEVDAQHGVAKRCEELGVAVKAQAVADSHRSTVRHHHQWPFARSGRQGKV
ncbi:MAG: hypothetical protein BWZ07_03256 [Alphaproteobacteria bacterium ADurb.BinA280]|nr:MAG: hypothetical protein BWZ07_03256 [Alphaproteobacteria bacterium ADurb.BinA280]